MSNGSDFEPNSPDVLPSNHSSRKVTRLFLILATVGWASLVVAGLWFLGGYENAPGAAAKPPGQWPSVSRIQLEGEEPTLVMLAHPRCPCTRASIGELASIMAHSQGRLRAFVLFVKPEGSNSDWEQTDLWRSAANIPGVNVVSDPDGVEARLFDAVTSGQTVLYNSGGRLIFSGGITSARGHYGDNAGQSAIIALVNTEVPTQTETSVFGCPLFNPDSECQVNDDGNKY